MTYIVKYKLPDDKFWNKIKKVKGDGIMPECAYRFFILEDESRIEIPLGHLFKFGKERFFVIKTNMEKESGMDIKVNSEV